LQRDLKGYFDGMNLYSYARNNPLSLIDLLGTESGGIVTFGVEEDLLNVPDNRTLEEQLSEVNQFSREALHSSERIYGEQKIRLLTRELRREGMIDMAKFGGAMYALGTFSALGGLAYGGAGATVAGAAGLGETGTLLTASAAGGMGSSLSWRLLENYFGRSTTLSEWAMTAAVGLGAGLISGGAGALYSRYTAPVGLHIATPSGPKFQVASAEYEALAEHAKSGNTLYRIGTTNNQYAWGEPGSTRSGASGQFWSFENPATSPNYSKDMGLPTPRRPGYNWIMGGTPKPHAPLITRPAEAVGTNLGGAPEVVTDPGTMRIKFFHMPD